MSTDGVCPGDDLRDELAGDRVLNGSENDDSWSKRAVAATSRAPRATLRAQGAEAVWEDELVVFLSGSVDLGARS
jgi:hypothetical protein